MVRGTERPSVRILPPEPSSENRAKNPVFVFSLITRMSRPREAPRPYFVSKNGVKKVKKILLSETYGFRFFILFILTTILKLKLQLLR
ncbi:unnamed protein product, partial [marine sediment metagenome]